MKFTATIGAIIVSAAAMLCAAAPVPSEFTYQGVLKDTSQPFTGSADFIVRLYDGASLASSIGFLNTPINNGQFQLDCFFDPTLFDGTNYDLEILVRAPAGSGAYITLDPRQPLKATPYAYHANSADTLTTPAIISDATDIPLVTIDQQGTTLSSSALRAARGTTSGLFNTFIDRVIEVDTIEYPIGLIGYARNFPVVGYLNEFSRPEAIAVYGEISPDADPAQTAIGGANLATGNSAYLATGNFAGRFIGDVRISGDIIKSYVLGSYDLAAPIAYGYIDAAGNVVSGTPNVSAVYNASQFRYEILIDNENYFYNQYVTVITTTSPDVTARTGSVSGRLLVSIESTATQAFTTAGFAFVTYKPDGAPLVQGQRKPPLQPVNTPYTDEIMHPQAVPAHARTPIIEDELSQSRLKQHSK